MTAAVARPHRNRIELNRGQRLSYGEFSAAVGADAADGDPNEAPRRLGRSAASGKKHRSRAELLRRGQRIAHAGGRRDKRVAFPVAEAKGAAASKARIGERPGSVHELSRQAEGLTGEDRGNAPIASICPPQHGHRSRALSGSR